MAVHRHGMAKIGVQFPSGPQQKTKIFLLFFLLKPGFKLAMSNYFLALLALIFGSVLGGLAPIFAKFALREFNPFFILFLRFCGAVPFFLLFLSFKKELKIRKKDLFKIIILGTFFSANVIFFLVGVQFTTAIVSQILYLLVPLLAILFSALFFKEKFRPAQIFGAFIGFWGGFLIVFKSAYSLNLIYSLGSLKGNLLVFLAVISWTSYLIFSKKYLLKSYSPLALTAFSSCIALFYSLLVLLSPLNNKPLILSKPTFWGIFSILSLIFLISLLMMFLYQYGNKHTSPFAVGITQYLSPFSAALASIPLFGEKLNLNLILGGFFIFLGFFLAVLYPQLASFQNKKNKKN